VVVAVAFEVRGLLLRRELRYVRLRVTLEVENQTDRLRLLLRICAGDAVFFLFLGFFKKLGSFASVIF
jgi:hypothetical protein